jgi:hypothetical protein
MLIGMTGAHPLIPAYPLSRVASAADDVGRRRRGGLREPEGYSVAKRRSVGDRIQLASSELLGWGFLDVLIRGLIGIASCAILLAAGMGLGYLVHPEPNFVESAGAGIGAMVGLAAWFSGVGWFFWVGGTVGWRERGAARK